MPKISRNQPAKKRKREPVTFVDEVTGEEVRVSSVLFGFVMLIAIIVALAAWMGGSMSQIESRFAGFIDDTARMAGVSVNEVSVLGLEQDPGLQQEIRAAAMIEPGENMFRADPYIIRRRVEGTHKVLNVRVHRLWPDQVVIIADAAEPVAVWHDGKEWTVVDGLGRVIPDERAGDHPDLVRVAGRGAPEAAPALVTALADAPDVTGDLAIATRINDRRWDMRLISGATVRLPEDVELTAALGRLTDLQVRTALMQRPLKMIDLRNAGRVYLGPVNPPNFKAREIAARS
ncbi:cell division protein FtsQ/DivIB [Hyphomonas adhaerens]|uniref:cell division protein FtsQ/DivIB n=1 Tax=Hyphomonas adhaerens TaxID=81029 RepID=UPI002356C27F|nr:cell division protein FtsQ/DivIB [Hyphomonas adhaerens]